MSTLPNSPPKPIEPTFTFTLENLAAAPYGSGGFYVLKLNGRGLFNYQAWAFGSCGAVVWSGFSNYVYNHSARNAEERRVTNYTVLEEHHEKLFKWMELNGPDTWRPREFLMLLSDPQLPFLTKMLQHPCVKKVDSYMNKSHGPCRLHLYRISLLKDFK